jgi:lipopolysaccharide transport system permease protein
VRAKRPVSFDQSCGKESYEGVVNSAIEALSEVNAKLELERRRGENPTWATLPVTILERKPGWQVIDLGELWRFRELLYFLTMRDIKVRYKQTILGAAWAILQPLATMLVFSLFFGRVARNPSSAVPYPLFVLSGLVPWMFFSNAIAQAGQSVVGNQNLVTKIYFPRLIIPMGAVGAGLVDLAISFAMLVVLMFWFGMTPGWSFALVPLFAFGLVIAALGVGTLLSALTVAYRDFRYAVPFFVQFWMFATPCIYMQTKVSSNPGLIHLLPLNPAYGLIANLRQAMLGGPIDLYSLGVSSAVSVFLLVIGSLYFRRVERDFADII